MSDPLTVDLDALGASLRDLDTALRANPDASIALQYDRRSRQFLAVIEQDGEEIGAQWKGDLPHALGEAVAALHRRAKGEPL